MNRKIQTMQWRTSWVSCMWDLTKSRSSGTWEMPPGMQKYLLVGSRGLCDWSEPPGNVKSFGNGRGRAWYQALLLLDRKTSNRFQSNEETRRILWCYSWRLMFMGFETPPSATRWPLLAGYMLISEVRFLKAPSMAEWYSFISTSSRRDQEGRSLSLFDRLYAVNQAQRKMYESLKYLWRRSETPVFLVTERPFILDLVLDIIIVIIL